MKYSPPSVVPTPALGADRPKAVAPIFIEALIFRFALPVVNPSAAPVIVSTALEYATGSVAIAAELPAGTTTVVWSGSGDPDKKTETGSGVTNTLFPYNNTTETTGDEPVGTRRVSGVMEMLRALVLETVNVLLPISIPSLTAVNTTLPD
jgi:hypothetical protein